MCRAADRRDTVFCMTGIYLGVDPGLNGAIALLVPAERWMRTMDIPTHTVTVGGKQRKRLDARKLENELKALVGSSRITLAAVEDVHSMPKQGVASAFSFGFVAGAIQQALTAREVPITLVAPASWKRFLEVPANKDAARRRASQLLPFAAELWPLAKHDGRAEASLLAYYGSLLYAATFT